MSTTTKILRPYRKTGKMLSCKRCGTEKYIPVNRLDSFKYCSYYCSNYKGEQKNTGRTHLKKGKILFKGSLTEYKLIHQKIARLLGKPEACESCGKSGLKGRLIHWANKSGKYLLNKTDWIRLCAKCHFYYDKQYLRI